MNVQIQVDNKVVEVCVFGNKKNVILLLPGWTHDFQSEKGFIDELSKKYKVITISYPGYYGSEENIKAQSTLYLAKIVNSVVNNLKVKNFKVLGFSMGCQVALQYKFKYNKQVDLILISPVLYSLQKEVPYYGRVLLASNFVTNIIRNFNFIKLFLVNQAYKKVFVLTEGNKNKIEFDQKNISITGAYDTLLATINSFISPFKVKGNIKFIFGEKEILQNKLGKNLKYDIIPSIGHGGFDKMYKEIVKAIN